MSIGRIAPFIAVSLICMLALVACGSGGASEEPTGFLSGKVSFACAASIAGGAPLCDVSPELYASQELFVYELDGTTLVSKTNPNTTGDYSFELAPGTYLVTTTEYGAPASLFTVTRGMVLLSGETVEINIEL